MHHLFTSDVIRRDKQQERLLTKEIDTQRLAKEVSENVKRILEQQLSGKEEKKEK